MFLPKLIGPDSVTNCETSFGLVEAVGALPAQALAV